jgi:hypothetical protein
MGTVTIDATGTKTTILTNITASPGQDKVYEAWLIDEGGSNYKLSLGQANNGTLQYTANLVNQYTFKQFIITKEPKADTDPNAVGTIAEAELPPHLDNNLPPPFIQNNFTNRLLKCVNLKYMRRIFISR